MTSRKSTGALLNIFTTCREKGTGQNVIFYCVFKALIFLKKLFSSLENKFFSATANRQVVSLLHDFLEKTLSKHIL